MDLEKAMQFIVERQAQTEAILQQAAEDRKQAAEDHKRLEASHVRLGENLIALTDIVRQLAEAQQRHEEQFQRHEERFQRKREEDEAFHREVDERFNALIKMMDEWIRGQRNGNGAS